MIVEAGTIYDSFIFVYRHPIWKIMGPISGDLVAGLLLGMDTLIYQVLIHDGYIVKDGKIEITSNNLKIRILIDILDELQYNLAMTNYKLDTVVMDEDILLTHDQIINGKYRPLHGSFGWWIKDEQRNSYVLYSFASLDFIQGFISICNAFGVDFRDYILGQPFIYEEGMTSPQYYSVEGYDIDPIVGTKIPAPIDAFYTGVYGSDPYGQDYE